MNIEQYYLTVLAEECAETAQRATKAIRFGLNEIQEGQSLTNAQRLVYEFNDLYAMMVILHEHGFIDAVVEQKAVDFKKEKVEHYLKYSKRIGIVV